MDIAILSECWYRRITRSGGIITGCKESIDVSFPHGRYAYHYNIPQREMLVNYDDGRLFKAYYRDLAFRTGHHANRYYTITYNIVGVNYCIAINTIPNHKREFIVSRDTAGIFRPVLDSVILPDNSAVMVAESVNSFKMLYRSNTGTSIMHEYKNASVVTTLSAPGFLTKKITQQLYDADFPIHEVKPAQ
jgi:hypothetical protein